MEQERTQLIHELGRYATRRRRHQLIVVFDGWKSGDPCEGQQSIAGITVIFSKLGERADQVIQRLCVEYGTTAVVVSSDREISDYARNQGNFTISAQEFEQRLRQTSSNPTRHQIKDEAALNAPAEPHRGGKPTGKKKGNPRKLTKKERLRNRRLQQF
jgi:predicted RNA-binding protein with PIN domain